MNCKRANKTWTTVELLSLQREYELLELNVSEIAVKHGRSVQAILYKLESEGFIESFVSARGYSKDIVTPYIEVCDTSTVLVNDRLTSLESSLGNIRDAIEVLASRFDMKGRSGKMRGMLSSER